QQRVERIVILPTSENNTLTVMQGETVNFTAVALNREQPVSGAPFKWSYTYVSRNRPPKTMNNGTFIARSPGKYLITASAQGVQGQVTLLVNPNEGYGLQKLLQKPENQRTERERQNLSTMLGKAEVSTREISSKKIYREEDERQLDSEIKQRIEQVKAKQLEVLKRRPDPQVTPTPKPNEEEGANQKGGPNAEDQTEVDYSKVEGASPNTEKSREEFIPEPIPYRPADDDGWTSTNWSTADDPVNQVGNTPGTAPDGGASNDNFQFAAPVLSLPGRGIDVNLALVYNSRLWSKTGTQMIYDADKGFPAPGWSIGFGKMIRMGTTGGCMLATSDGSRHSYDGSNSHYSSGSYYSDYYVGHTTDGSFIDYSCGYN
ncbi:MAG TPA: hypothetical protein PKY82_21055, partial [Pyrinomonadaceae bacterium]|nr:hypothetical protein [Pyrinomonadaceae bacterium]